MDFTIKSYRCLINTLLSEGYKFITFKDYCERNRPEKFIILRHDIDKNPERALRIAEIEHSVGIISSFYFLIHKKVFNERIVSKISNLGHEVGYHYKDFTCNGGNVVKAIKDFEKNLNKMREVVVVNTIVMDGRPWSVYDNRDLWKSYNYRDFGIIGEPYFDMNFNEVFYLTDTGRCWDGAKYSVRDKVQSDFRQSYHSTRDIMVAAENGTLPDKIMITTHPQRWTNSPFAWLAEFLAQNLKNMIKQFIVIFRT